MRVERWNAERWNDWDAKGVILYFHTLSLSQTRIWDTLDTRGQRDALHFHFRDRGAVAALVGGGEGEAFYEFVVF